MAAGQIRADVPGSAGRQAVARGHRDRPGLAGDVAQRHGAVVTGEAEPRGAVRLGGRRRDPAGADVGHFVPGLRQGVPPERHGRLGAVGGVAELAHLGLHQRPDLPRARHGQVVHRADHRIVLSDGWARRRARRGDRPQEGARQRRPTRHGASSDRPDASTR